MRVLVTGGAGYIGSHTCLALLASGHEVTVIDDLSNSSAEAVARLQGIAGKKITFIKGDVRRPSDLRLAFGLGQDAVVHFAALKAVGESCEVPLEYFSCNISGSIALLQEMARAGVYSLVFSSSATVYGQPKSVPVSESAELCVTNPYGRTKLVVEQLIQDYCRAEAKMGAVLLRYFNPVGAHASGLIGEDPSGTPNNLMPYVAQVAIGKRERLRIFGNDYPTPDGTGIRDYIHAMDLAEAHVLALGYACERKGAVPINIGAGRGYSVLELVNEFEQECGHSIEREFVGRRNGDVAEIWADCSLAKDLLNWTPRRNLSEMCRDAWKWQSLNPNGYEN